MLSRRRRLQALPSPGTFLNEIVKKLDRDGFVVNANSEETERLVINRSFLRPNPSQELLDFLGAGKLGVTSAFIRPIPLR